MEKITLNSELEAKVKEYAKKHKISFQKACERLFDAGVCHLQKKDIKKSRTIFPLETFFCAGVCHPRRITRTITITETTEFV